MKRYAFRTFKLIHANDEDEAREMYKIAQKPELEVYCIATFCDECGERIMGNHECT